jgi:hypothetical protein
VSFIILYQLFCVGHTIQVRSPGKAKNQQVVGKLLYIPLGTSNFDHTSGIAEKKYYIPLVLMDFLSQITRHLDNFHGRNDNTL